MVSLQSLENCAESADHICPITDKKEDRLNRLQRAQWLRAAILGANDGLLSTISLMLGVGAAREDQWSMIIFGLAGALAGPCSMAVGEFVPVSTQHDIERAILEHYGSNCNPEVEKGGGDIVLEIITNLYRIVKANLSLPPEVNTPSRFISSRDDQRPSLSGITPGRRNFSVVSSPTRSPMMRVLISDHARGNTLQGAKVEEEGSEDGPVLPNSYKSAIASASTFLCGSVLPLLSAMIVSENLVRIAVIVVVSSIALALFGCMGARLGDSKLTVSSSARVLVGGWISMAITYSLLKPLDKVSDREDH